MGRSDSSKEKQLPSQKQHQENVDQKEQHEPTKEQATIEAKEKQGQTQKREEANDDLAEQASDKSESIPTMVVQTEHGSVRVRVQRLKFELMRYTAAGYKLRTYTITSDGMADSKGKVLIEFAHLRRILLGKATRVLKDSKKASGHDNGDFFSLVDAKKQELNFETDTGKREALLIAIVDNLRYHKVHKDLDLHALRQHAKQANADDAEVIKLKTYLRRQKATARANKKSSKEARSRSSSMSQLTIDTLQDLLDEKAEQKGP